jgi:Phosphotransferase enzyme family
LSLNDNTRSGIVVMPGGGRVFVKANQVPSRHEAGRYRALAGSGVPTACLLQALVLPPVEVLVLECLDRIGISFESPAEVHSLLRLVAALNAARVDASLVPAGSPQPGMDAAVLSALRTVAGSAVDRWWVAYQWAATRVSAMPTALCHGEFHFQQVGWATRDGRPTLVVFDLETLAYRPRFADIASILYALAASTGRSQVELLSLYLDELRQHTGTEIDVEAAFTELRLLRFTDSCWGLPWMLRQHAEAPGSVPLELTLECMREDLPAIGS